MKQVVFSGCKPTGNLTLANYIGAISQWIEMQDEYESIFCIVDLHAMTTIKNPEHLKNKSLDFFALYIACGLRPEDSTIFIQSQNPHHAELSWILNCCTAYGDLTRMTQFKDKAQDSDFVSAGLLNYPVLMAADILLYKTAVVPIGEDQKQHLELSRDIARRFNHQYGEMLTVPEPMIPRQGGRIRHLLDPTRKMDKSHENERTYIGLLDSDTVIRSKIRKAKTDSTGAFPIDNPDEGITNLVTMMAKLTEEAPSEIVCRYHDEGYGKLKNDLSDVIIAFLKPLQQKYESIREDVEGLNRLMRIGLEKATERSEETIKDIKTAVGLF
jgi:tryptophanyl-tRNA synthetase